MTTILSTPATARLAERIARQVGGPLTHGDLVRRLEDLDVADERAAAGIGLAIVLGRLQAVEAEDGLLLRARPTSHDRQGGAA